MPLVANHGDGKEKDEEIDGVQPRETGEPELTFDQEFATVGVVVGEDVAGDEEEDADEDVAIVDEWKEKAEVRRREVEEDNREGEKGADAGERRQRRLARDCGLGSRSGRPLDLGFGL